METFHFRSMNTDILLVAQGIRARIAEGFEEAQRFIQASEGRFSRFSGESELSELNRSAGTPFQASPDLFSVIALAQRFFHQTRGLFDPSILPDLRRVGYDRSMDLLRQQGAVPLRLSQTRGLGYWRAAKPPANTPRSSFPPPRGGGQGVGITRLSDSLKAPTVPLFESLLAGEYPSFSEMDLDETRGMILLPPGMALDLGGIAKGWIAEQAAIILSEFSSACAVNAGGDMFLVGLPDGEEQWPVAIEDPLQPEIDLTIIKVDPGAVATSAVTKRVWKQGEKQRHHLIDPRTGEPALTDWLSVTVIAPHAYEAEVFAKALLIGGPQESGEITRNCGTQFSYLAVDHDRKIWGTHKSLEYFSILNT
ncbi:MAG TPA: FAD:protein FMN transferase [Anaerolineales bacterium]